MTKKPIKTQSFPSQQTRGWESRYHGPSRYGGSCYRWRSWPGRCRVSHEEGRRSGTASIPSWRTCRCSPAPGMKKKRGILNGIDWDEKGINKWDGFWYDEKENAGVGFTHVLIWGLEPVWRRPFVWKSRSGNTLSVQRSDVRKIDLQRLNREREEE